MVLLAWEGGHHSFTHHTPLLPTFRGLRSGWSFLLICSPSLHGRCVHICMCLKCVGKYLSRHGLPNTIANTIDWVASTADIYFLTVLEAGESKSKVQPGLVSGESSLPSLRTAPFSLCAHMASPQCSPMRRDISLSSSFCKATNLIRLGSHSYDLIQLELLPKSPIAKYWGLGF